MNEELFFKVIETKINEEIPIFIKKSLYLMGYTNTNRMKEFRNEQFPRLFNEISEQMKRFYIGGQHYSASFVALIKKHIDERNFKVHEYKIPMGYEQLIEKIFYEMGANVNVDFSRTQSQMRQTSFHNISPREKRLKLFQVNSLSHEEMESFPILLRMFIDNAMINKAGNKNNSYSLEIKQLSSYIFIRNGRHQYEFFQENLNLPHLSTVRRFMDEEMSSLKEGVLDFDGLRAYLVKNSLPSDIAITEDGTKITEVVEYFAKQNVLTGLSAPLSLENGLPSMNFEAHTAKMIYDHLQNNEKSTYVQVLLAVPNHPNARAFFLGYYSTTNRFKSEHVTARYKYIRNELEKREIKIIAFSSDGDVRFLKSQKQLCNFGSFKFFGPIILAGNIDSQYLSIQDGLHIAKKMKNILYNISGELKMANFHISHGFLLRIYKNFDKIEHGLTKNDLDHRQKMDYTCLQKITNQKVFDCLQRMPRTEGMITYLDLIRRVLVTLVHVESTINERIYEGAYVIYFLRLWRQHLHNTDKKNHSKYFITSNAHEGFEISYITLLKIAIDNKGDNLHRFSSQENEKFFRMLRSFTSIESSDVNFGIKNFVLRVQRIIYADSSKDCLKDKIRFPRTDEQNLYCTESTVRYKLTENEIFNLISKGISDAEEKAKSIGLVVDTIVLSHFFKTVQTESQRENEWSDGEDFLGVEITVEENQNDNEELLKLNNLAFENKSSDNDSLVLTNGQSFSKQKFLKLLQDDCFKVSSDIRHRFIAQRKFPIDSINTNDKQLWKTSTIVRGDYILMKVKDTLIRGCVLNIRYINQKTFNQTVYYGDSVDLSIESGKLVGVLLDPVFVVKYDKEIHSNAFMDYINVNNYLLHSNEIIDYDLKSNKVVISQFLKE